ncbi:MAG: glycosyltransferase family 2 protein [Pseudomonadota bacterium]
MAAKRPVTWATISTIKASPKNIDRFATHHLGLGARQMFIFLDDPNQEVPPWMEACEEIKLSRCDAAHWDRLKNPRPEISRQRQAANANHAYGQVRATWAIHLDGDEFLLPSGGRTVTELLENAKPSLNAWRVAPGEYLGEASRKEGIPVFKRHLARKYRALGLHLELYPTFGARIKQGFLSHTDGKSFLRTGVRDMTVGIHRGLDRKGAQEPSKTLDNILLGHAHARCEADFIEQTPRRLAFGGYKPYGCQRRQAISDVLNHALETDGEVGLLHVYRELMSSDPAVLDRLRAHSLLFRARQWPGLCDPRDGTKVPRGTVAQGGADPIGYAKTRRSA